MKVLRWPFSILLLFLQSMSLAMVQIWSNKTRSVLTMLGIIIGVASVISVVAILDALQRKVLSDFETVGTNKLFINPSAPENPREHYTREQLRFRISDFDDLLNRCPSIKSFGRVNSFSTNVRHGSKSKDNVPVNGIEPTWYSIEQRNVLMGRPFSPVDDNRAVCEITPTTRDKLSLPYDPVGSSLQISNRRFIIVGMVENEAQMNLFGGGEPGLEVLIPFSTAYNSLDKKDFRVTAVAKSSALSEEAHAELNYFLRHARRLRPDQEDNFGVFVMQKFIDQFNKTATTLTLVAIGVVGISLLVGGVGIMNIMLVSVSERTREIGLRKAVGARPSAILLQFLVEAVTLCLVGGLVGVLGGQGLANLVASIPVLELKEVPVPVWAVMLAFGFSAGVGLLFGMLPAIKASRLDPIEALRHS